VRRISVRNAAFQHFVVLQTNRNKRHAHGEFIVEGVRNIGEAVKNGWRVKSFIYSGERKLSRWAAELLASTETEVNYQLSAELMDELSGKAETSELLAVVDMLPPHKPCFSGNPIFALFDRPSNKGNLGTMLRSCDAFGVEQLIITGHGVDIYDPEVVAASMGSFFAQPFARLSDNAYIDGYIADLKAKFPGLTLVGTTSHSQTRLRDIDMTVPILFLIGNETDGLSHHYTELSDIMATIPMSERSAATSFNVSCAATVLLYEARRQRGN
jgi:TrmH family RNA methyltransferase